MTPAQEIIHNAVALFGYRCTDDGQKVWLKQARAYLAGAGIAEQPTSEIDRLQQRLVEEATRELKEPGDRRLIGMSVTWGPSAAGLTSEERAGVVNRLFDTMDQAEIVPIEAIDGEPMQDFPEKPRTPHTLEEFLASCLPVREI